MTESELRFCDEIAAFEVRDQLSPPPVAPVLFYGSSSIRMWDTIHEDFPDWTVVRRGFGGSTLRECAHWCERLVVRYAPSRIVLYAGDNDLADGASPEKVLHYFQSLEHHVRRALGPVPLVYISIKLSPARWHLRDKILHTNHLIGSLIERFDHLTYVDVTTLMLNEHGLPRTELYSPDGLHLSCEGYRLWAARLHDECDF